MGVRVRAAITMERQKQSWEQNVLEWLFLNTRGNNCTQQRKNRNWRYNTGQRNGLLPEQRLLPRYRIWRAMQFMH